MNKWGSEWVSEWMEPGEVEMSAFARQNGSHATDSTRYLSPWPSSVLLHSVCNLLTYFVTHLHSIFPVRMQTPWRRDFSVHGSPSLLPKTRTVPGNIVEIQYISADILMNTSLKKRENQPLFGKGDIFQVCFLRHHPLHFYSPLLGEIATSLHGLPLVSSSLHNHTEHVFISASNNCPSGASSGSLLLLFCPQSQGLHSLSIKAIHIPQSRLFPEDFLTPSLLWISTGPRTSQVVFRMH